MFSQKLSLPHCVTLLIHISSGSEIGLAVHDFVFYDASRLFYIFSFFHCQLEMKPGISCDPNDLGLRIL